MVTTFSTRLLSLSNRCIPIIDGHKKQKSDAIYNFTNSNTKDRATANQQTAAQPPNKKNSIKMQGGNHDNSYYYAYTLGGYFIEKQATSSKRGTLIQRRHHPISSRRCRSPSMSILTRERREGCRVMTSREFDEMENNHHPVYGSVKQADDTLKTDPQAQGCEEEEAPAETTQDVSLDIIGRSRRRNRTTSNLPVPVARSDEYNVSSMHMLGSLVQSTRHYYNFPCDDTTTVSTPIVSNLPSKKRARYTAPSTTSLHHTTSEKSMNSIINSSSNEDSIIKKAMRTCAQYQYNTNHNDEKLSEDGNSEGLSSWTPTSSCGELADNDQNDIDNDNRSDGQSSDIGDGEETSSDDSSDNSISSSEEHHDGISGISNLFTKDLGFLLGNGAFSIVG